MDTTSRTSLRALLLCAAMLALAACDGPGKTTDGAGSETHFLADCTQSCGQGFSCICGVCTQLCEDDVQCESLGAECYSSVALAIGEACSMPPQTPVSVCHSECTVDADCARVGSRHTCQGGFCVQPPPTTNPPGDATDDDTDDSDTDTFVDIATGEDTAGEDTADTKPSCTPTPSACDGLDNDCDGQIDEVEYGFETTPGNPPADAAPWSLTILGDTHYAATTVGTAVAVYDLSTGARLASLDGHSPVLFASEQGQQLVLFYVAAANSELGQPQDEVHVVSVSPLGALGTATCLGCDDDRRGEKGGILEYDVAFAGVDTDLDGLNDPDDTGCQGDECGYVTVYTRSTLQLYSARAVWDTLELQTNSEGIVLSFQEQNSNVYDVDVEIRNPAGLAFLGVFRNDHSQDELTLASVLSSNRTQVNASSLVHSGGQLRDERVAIHVLGDSNVVVARITADFVEVTRFELAEATMKFEVIDGPLTLAPTGPDSAPTALWLAPGRTADELQLLLESRNRDSGEHHVEGYRLALSEGTLAETLAFAPRPGRSPRTLDTTASQPAAGILVATTGATDPVTEATALTPAVLQSSCD